MVLRFNQPGGRRSAFYEINPDGHDVILNHPVRTQYGSMRWIHRFTPREARELAAALAIGADQADTAPPELQA